MSTDTDLDAAASGGGDTSSSDTVHVPVRFPGVRSKNGSANSTEHGMGSIDGRTVLMDTKAARYAINGWTEDQQRDIAKKMWYLGLLDSPQDLEGVYRVWDKGVAFAARFANTDKPMEVQDALELIADGSPAAIKRRAQQARSGNVVTQKQRSINISNPGEARALIEQAFQSSMGRDPTDAEVRTMTSALQAEQKSHPTTTTQTSHYAADGSVASQDSTSEGGIDPSEFVRSQAESDPEAAEYQAGTSYFSALMQALGSGVPGT